MDEIQKDERRARKEAKEVKGKSTLHKRTFDAVLAQADPSSPIRKKVPLPDSEDESHNSDQKDLDEILGKVTEHSPNSKDANSSISKGTLVYSSADYISLVSAENLSQTKIIHNLVKQLIGDWEGGPKCNTIMDRILADDIKHLITTCLSAALVSDTFDTPLLSVGEHNSLRRKAERLEIDHHDWSSGNPSDVLIPTLLWRIKGTTSAPRDCTSFLAIMKANSNPFGFSTQETSWEQGLIALSDIDITVSPWVQTLKDIIRELSAMATSEDDPLAPVWAEMANNWNMLRTADATRLYPTAEKLANGFAMALQRTKAQLLKSTEIKFLDPRIMTALKFSRPYKASAKAKGSGEKKSEKPQHEKDRGKQTSSDKAIMCWKCGNAKHEAKECRLSQEKHPDINTENVPWAESNIGKAYMAKGRHSVRKTSRLVGGVFVEHPTSSSTASATGNDTYDIITHI